MTKFRKVFGHEKPVIAMLHLAGRNDQDVVQRALYEMEIFKAKGVNAVIVENYHGDLEQVILTLRALEGKYPGITVGVNVLPNEYRVAFPLAAKYGASFIQLDHVAGKYEGRGTLDADDYAKFRQEYPQIAVLGGVHPKYYKPVPGSDLAADLKVAMGRSDAIVVTGEGTGIGTPMDKIKMFRKILGPGEPLIVGAGVNALTAPEQLAVSDGAIVGSAFKGGVTESLTRPELVEEFMKAARGKPSSVDAAELEPEPFYKTFKEGELVNAPSGQKYRVLKHGDWKGRRGYVVKAIDAQGQTVALKFALNQKPETLASFAKEAKKLKDLAATGVRAPKALEIGADFNVKEWIEGPSPEDWVKVWSRAGYPRASKELKDIAELIATSVRNGKFIDDLNRKNLVWDGSHWVVIDSGSVVTMPPAEALRNYLQEVPRKWAKYQSPLIEQMLRRRLRSLLEEVLR